MFQSDDGLKKVFDEIKTGFSAWFYKHMCNQRNHRHAATYDRVVQFFFLQFIHRIIDIYLDTLLQTYIWYIKCAGKREDKVAIKFLVDISEMRDEVIVTEKTKAPVSKTE